MITFNNERNETTWQSSFVAMLPEIQQKLHLAFCRLDPEAREDAIEEGVVHSLLAYIRLHELGRAEAATPSSLAWYSSRHVKRGRPAAGRMNGKEPLSRYGQISNDIEVELQPGNWIDAIVQDKRAPVFSAAMRSPSRSPSNARSSVNWSAGLAHSSKGNLSGAQSFTKPT
jgi:hypothetical protein